MSEQIGNGIEQNTDNVEAEPIYPAHDQWKSNTQEPPIYEDRQISDHNPYNHLLSQSAQPQALQQSHMVQLTYQQPLATAEFNNSESTNVKHNLLMELTN